MAEVLLFHHAQGLTAGVHAFADRLRRAGHLVHVPDLYEGRTFHDIESGVGYAEELGFGTIIERGIAEAENMPAKLVSIGFSLGVMPAQQLAQKRAGAAGAVLVGSAVPASEFGDVWPDDVPLQIHGMDADPIFTGEGDLDVARELVDSAPRAELFLYPGDQHLFIDSSLSAYDETASDLLIERVLGFLDAANQQP